MGQDFAKRAHFRPSENFVRLFLRTFSPIKSEQNNTQHFFFTTFCSNQDRPKAKFFNKVFCTQLMADGPQRARLPIPPTATLPSCLWSLRIFPSFPGSRLTFFLSRCKFSTLTTRQPMVEFILLRRPESKSCLDKNRTHGFRAKYCPGYLLDNPDDKSNELKKIGHNYRPIAGRAISLRFLSEDATWKFEEVGWFY